MKLLLVIIVLILAFPSIVNAQRGCCSHHGGVSHCDSSIGRKVCNDGSYSPSCTCAVAAPVQEVEQIQPVYLAPKKIDIFANLTSNRVSAHNHIIYFDWDDVGGEFSVYLDKDRNKHPDTIAETSVSEWTFNSVTPGKWWVSLIRFDGNAWSNPYYWEIEIADEPPTTPTPSPTPTIESETNAQTVSIARNTGKIWAIHGNDIFNFLSKLLKAL